MKHRNRYSKITSIFKSRLVIIIILSAVVLAGGSLALQSEFAVTSVWEADIEFTGATVNSIYTSYDDIAAIDKSKSRILFDPDGESIAILTSMNSAGLLPDYELSLSNFFHTDKFGVSTTDKHPKEDVIRDGTRYLTYYFGFSTSMLTRGNKLTLSPTTTNFDYYGQNLAILYQVPEFRSGNIGASVGIRLVNTDDFIPSDCGVIKVTELKNTARYTAAASFGMPEDIVGFNQQYQWKSIYKHNGYVSLPSTTVQNLGMGGIYSAIINVGANLDPGSEYIVSTGMHGQWIGGSFNLFDVEIIVDYLVEVQLDYAIAADIGGYLAGRLDITVPEEPFYIDWFVILMAIFGPLANWLRSVFGLDSITSLIISAIVMVFGILIFILLLKRLLLRRVTSRVTRINIM